MTQLSMTPDLQEAIQHHQAGRLHEAEQLYRQVLQRHPQHPIALHHLGCLAFAGGRSDIAIELIRRALAHEPQWPDAHSNLGNILRQAGQTEQAIAACRQAILLRPNFGDAYVNLGMALSDNGDLNGAIDACRQAIRFHPDLVQAYINLGCYLETKGDFSESIATSKKALALRPDCAQAYNNLGIALAHSGQLEEGIAAYRQAIALDANLPEAFNNLGYALKRNGKIDEALAASRRAVALAPQYAEAHFNIAAIRLLRGEWTEGFAEYEWRWKCADFPVRFPDFPQPLWDGRELDGQTILLYTEQGNGDAMQFARYVPPVVKRGGQVIILCQKGLGRLFAASFPQCRVISREDSLPAFDFHASIMSLPHILGASLPSASVNVPYLSAEEAEAASWRKRIMEIARGFKVGLVWRGSKRDDKDDYRSMTLSEFAPILEIGALSFFSLQKDGISEDDRHVMKRFSIIDWTNDFADFAATAGLIENLDLIISVDTAVAHLGGAMGRPVLTLLPPNSDWRWMLNRSDSPWYPTMKLFRSPVLGQWPKVIAELVKELRERAGR